MWIFFRCAFHVAQKHGIDAKSNALGRRLNLRNQVFVLWASIVAGCSAARVTAEHPAPQPQQYTLHSIVLPGAPAGGVFMDYLAYDRTRHRVWVPAGNTGGVDVIDLPTESVASIGGFATADVERQGTKRTIGPSSAAVGVRVVYIGNRGDSSVCAVDAESLEIGPCIRLDAMPDGLAFVAATKEVWVTTPRDKSIVVIDAATPGALTRKAKIQLNGQPEGFAVDDRRGVFYTNLEDQDRTLRIDVKTRQVTSTWLPNCGAGGPKGLSLDHSLNFLLVACPNRVRVLDVAHEGKELSTIEVGDGVDNIDYVEPRREVYAAAARAATLTIARLDPQGRLTPVATVSTASGARNAVATDEGTVYLTDSPEGKILVAVPVNSN